MTIHEYIIAFTKERYKQQLTQPYKFHGLGYFNNKTNSID